MTAITALHTFRPVINLVDFGTHTLAKYTWPKPESVKAHVLLVHGLGDHMGRYNNLAYVLYVAGYAVHGYDQIGHGFSSGVKGDIDKSNRLTEDLIKIIGELLLQEPLVILGHSLGGLVAYTAIAEKPNIADAIVMSSPAFAIHTKVIDKLILLILSKWFPHFKFNNRIDIAWLCRDAQIARDYEKDKLVHSKISTGLAAWIMKEGDLAVKNASLWKTPALLMYGGQDRLVNPKGSELIAQNVSNSFMQSVCYNVMYHEIFNDPEKNIVLRKLIEWLNNRYS